MIEKKRDLTTADQGEMSEANLRPAVEAPPRWREQHFGECHEAAQPRP